MTCASEHVVKIRNSKKKNSRNFLFIWISVKLSLTCSCLTWTSSAALKSLKEAAGQHVCEGAGLTTASGSVQTDPAPSCLMRWVTRQLDRIELQKCSIRPEVSGFIRKQKQWIEIKFRSLRSDNIANYLIRIDLVKSFYFFHVLLLLFQMFKFDLYLLNCLCKCWP